jgi:hypothetical protein
MVTVCPYHPGAVQGAVGLAGVTFAPNPALDPAVPASLQLVGVVALGSSGSPSTLLVVNLGPTDVDVGLDGVGFPCSARWVGGCRAGRRRRSPGFCVELCSAGTSYDPAAADARWCPCSATHCTGCECVSLLTHFARLSCCLPCANPMGRCASVYSPASPGDVVRQGLTVDHLVHTQTQVTTDAMVPAYGIGVVGCACA